MSELPTSIVVANPKGGCGKTTLVTQLACWYAGQEMRVVIADHDPQRSSLDWAQTRPAACFPVTVVSGTSAVPEHDLIIHDLPAGMPVDMLATCLVPESRLLIPILPSPTDIKAGVRFLMALNRSGLTENRERIGLVANRVKSNTRYYRILAEFLQQLNLPLITALRDTQNYVRATDAGISLFDLPAPLVRKDLEQWQPLIEWLQS